MAYKQFTVPEDIVVASDGFAGKITIEFEAKVVETSKSLRESTNRQKYENKMVLSDFHVVKKLRSGNFGQVYACYNEKTNKVYAIKVLDRSYV
jgi:serine/threonine protein kinase